MYTLQEYIHIHYITGITIISDTGIFSDHNLVISKCNLDLPSFVISKEKEERFNFWRIMPIPIKTKQGDEHPTPREDMYKGMEYRNHMELYNCLNKICRDPKHQITEQITLVKQ
jgi:hypothetical protein